MTTYLGKSCSFGLLRVAMYVFSYFPFGFEGSMWDLIVSVPDHCLSFYFFYHISCNTVLFRLFNSVNPVCLYVCIYTNKYFFFLL